MTNDLLSIANTSDVPELDKEKVFRRFYRHGDTGEEGNGLGLSIVKEICELAGFSIVYRHKENRHVFSIIFNKNNIR